MSFFFGYINFPMLLNKLDQQNNPIQIVFVHFFVHFVFYYKSGSCYFFVPHMHKICRNTIFGRTSFIPQCPTCLSCSSNMESILITIQHLNSLWSMGLYIPTLVEAQFWKSAGCSLATLVGVAMEQAPVVLPQQHPSISEWHPANIKSLCVADTDVASYHPVLQPWFTNTMPPPHKSITRSQEGKAQQQYHHSGGPWHKQQ